MARSFIASGRSTEAVEQLRLATTESGSVANEAGRMAAKACGSIHRSTRIIDGDSSCWKTVSEIILIDPAPTAADYQLLGEAYDAQSSYREAVAALEKATRLDATFQGYLELAWAQYMTDDYDRSLDSAKHALALKPGDSSALGAKCRASALKGSPDAVRDCREAVAADPGEGERRYYLGTALFDQKDNAAQGSWGIAIENLSRLPSMDAHDLYLRGNANFRLKQYDKAASDYAAALRLWPSFARAVLNLGSTFVVLAVSDEAKRGAFLERSREQYHILEGLDRDRAERLLDNIKKVTEMK